MPEPTLDQVAPGGVVQLNDAPAGLDDATFDSLFPADGQHTAVAPVQQTPAKQDVAPQGQQTPVVNQQPDFFLKGEKSVYRTPEEATRGINEKDAVIEQLRQRYALTTGIDPITGKPVAINGQPQPESIDYSQNPNQYLEDLYAAAKKGGPEAYRDVQQKFIFDTVAPLRPILQKAARDQATEVLNAELPDSKGFVGTPAYSRALDANPELKQAINVGETDHRFHSRLPGLYKLAYLTAQGMQLPELLKAKAPQTQPPPVTPAPVRTTVTPTTTTPTTTNVRPSFGNIEGIRAVIREMEGKGMRLDL